MDVKPQPRKVGAAKVPLQDHPQVLLGMSVIAQVESGKTADRVLKTEPETRFNHKVLYAVPQTDPEKQPIYKQSGKFKGIMEQKGVLPNRYKLEYQWLSGNRGIKVMALGQVRPPVFATYKEAHLKWEVNNDFVQVLGIDGDGLRSQLNQ